jgi:hypothetical protein
VAKLLRAGGERVALHARNTERLRRQAERGLASPKQLLQLVRALSPRLSVRPITGLGPRVARLLSRVPRDQVPLAG